MKAFGAPNTSSEGPQEVHIPLTSPQGEPHTQRHSARPAPNQLTLRNPCESPRPLSLTAQARPWASTRPFRCIQSARNRLEITSAEVISSYFAAHSHDVQRVTVDGAPQGGGDVIRLKRSSRPLRHIGKRAQRPWKSSILFLTHRKSAQKHKENIIL